MDFKDFGLQPICALTDQTKMTTESEAPAEPPLQGVAQVHESTSDLTDSGELSQSGSANSVSESIPIPTMRAFDSPMDSDEFENDEPLGVLPFCPLLPPENIKWRSEFTLEQLRQIAETEHCTFE